MAIIIIPSGTRVRVLDSPNIRQSVFKDEAVGYEFVTQEPLYKDGCILAPSNVHCINYKEGDLLVVGEINNNYQIYG